MRNPLKRAGCRGCIPIALLLVGGLLLGFPARWWPKRMVPVPDQYFLFPLSGGCSYLMLGRSEADSKNGPAGTAWLVVVPTSNRDAVTVYLSPQARFSVERRGSRESATEEGVVAAFDASGMTANEQSELLPLLATLADGAPGEPAVLGLKQFRVEPLREPDYGYLGELRLVGVIGIAAGYVLGLNLLRRRRST